MRAQKAFINFGGRIKEVREKTGYTQEYIASELGISQKAYSKIETNETQLKGEVLIRLAEILKVDIIELVPQEASLTYNNIHNVHKGDGIVYNKENVEKIEELYKQLIISKDQQIESYKLAIQAKDEYIKLLQSKK